MNDIKKKEINHFFVAEPSAVTSARTIILFGRNTSTYKFALWNALLRQQSTSSLQYGDLGPDFMQAFVDHYSSNPFQFSKPHNQLTIAIDSYLASPKSTNDFNTLMKAAEKRIYRYVFDAFHNVGRGSIHDDYRLFEHQPSEGKIVITDNLNRILENKPLRDSLWDENDSRWNVVEEAWRVNLPSNSLFYDRKEKRLYSQAGGRRTNLRSAVGVLMPYQKDRCFYCNCTMNRFAHKEDDAFPDVDHFFPWSLIENNESVSLNPDAVWNLVIACRQCNRGSDGAKWASPPVRRFFKRLKERNVLFVEEHKHSLRNSILSSLSASTSKEVGARMGNIFKYFEMFKGWEPASEYHREESLAPWEL